MNKNEISKAIYFDMDGTLANLYGVKDWLPSLRAYDPSPYTKAQPMINFNLLARYLNQLQRMGYTIGIISWLSKESIPVYDEAVRLRKRRYLEQHLTSVDFDEIHLVKYGMPKHYVAKIKNGILFDDNKEVREAWNGAAFDEKNILDVLKFLIVRESLN